MALYTKEEALRYHAEPRPGKLEVRPTKAYSTQKDLSLAYSPGVAEPCREIEKNPHDVYKYTNKGNLVAVISNGTAVLGLGDIGTLAAKPVMEGKGLLFKVFADIDVFDIEVNTKDIDQFVNTVKAIAGTFGGINLEDIKAPECFEIEKRLVEELDIPVMHDDQHGTAIISNAGLINALELVNKKLEDIKVVVSGAGAAAMACTKLMIKLGAKKENIIMVDSKGVIRKDRTDLNKYKQEFATDKDIYTLEEAIKGADVFFGLSKGGIVSKEMLRSMADNPIVFAMANPDPEITYEDAMAARDDVIMATGRSDYPNQVNNVLGFPFIFRGALDVYAKKINDEMKIAAVKALADLAKKEVPEYVAQAYNLPNLSFGRNYIIPKPLDHRLITHVAPAVAKAAIESGVARKNITDWDEYIFNLEKRMGLEKKIIRSIREKAKKSTVSIVFPEGEHLRIIKAAHEVFSENIANPILLGNKDKILQIAKKYELNLEGIKIIDFLSEEYRHKRDEYAERLWLKRQRKGLTLEEAKELLHNRNYFGAMMVETGDVQGMVSGYSTKYKDAAIAAIHAVGIKPGIKSAAGMYIVMTKKGTYFFADTTVNPNPSAEDLVNNAILAAEEVKKYGIKPVLAMLSYSNFGSVRKSERTKIVQQAVEILHKEHPEIIVDGDLQANIALDKEARDRLFPFNKLKGKNVNVLIFPSLSSGNISYKLLQTIGEAELIGPILLGLNKPIHIVPIDADVREIVNMAAITSIDIQSRL